MITGQSYDYHSAGEVTLKNMEKNIKLKQYTADMTK